MHTVLMNNTIVPVIDNNGRKIDERAFVNTPFAELFPDEKFVIIDWSACEELNAGDLVQPVVYDGVEYYGCYAWGSAVKRGQTIGLTRDLPRETGTVRNAEDGQRVQRWWLARGYAGGFTGTIRIMIARPHTLIPGCGPVEDGFGYIRNALLDQFSVPESTIELGPAKENYTFWQRIPADVVLREMSQRIADNILSASDLSNMLYSQAASFDQKKALVDVDRRLLEHPFVANSLSRASAEHYARLATNGSLLGDYRVAVPTTAPTVAWPWHQGRLIVARPPLQSDGSIQAVEVDEDVAEWNRISSMRVVQHSISNRTFSAKGCLGGVDTIPAGYDIILCSDDIKMTDGDLKALRKQFDLEIEAVVCFTQMWDGKSLIGVNAAWAKDRMGLDHDGDGVVVADANDLPLTWEAIKGFPYAETKKLVKTHTPLDGFDGRPEMILKSMQNMVGFATNVMSMTFAVQDREMVAHKLGFKTVATLDEFLDYAIKVGTDGFKTSVDMEGVERRLNMIQSNLQKMGIRAPWSNWPNDNAFRRYIPRILVEKVESDRPLPKGSACWRVLGEPEPVVLSKEEIENSVMPWWDGTIPTICRMTLPALKTILDTPIQTRPLTEFRSWAMKVTEAQYAAAKVIQDWFNARIQRVNFSDPENINRFREELMGEIKVWLERDGLDPRAAASALWRVAHSSRSSDASAASVFMAFPDESLWIIEHKPGVAINCTVTIITGVSYQVPNLISAETDVDVVDVQTHVRGRIVIRKAVVGLIDGQVQPRDPGYPRNMIGLVAANADQPAVGQYYATIKQVSQGAWSCVLA